MSGISLAAGIRHLRGLMAVQCRSAESDEQLLNAFTARGDEDAFAVLVRRHGPMVLHVCRRVLEHEQDAEDAFQATFLLLARNPAGLRNKSALAGFLHGAAYRIAQTAKRSAARRRKHEGSRGAPTQHRSPANPADELSWREVRALLDEEIARLPEKSRSVLVLCCLEGLSQAEAARRLGLNERTLSSRLMEARKRLSQRLRQRGLELTGVLTAAALAAPQASAVPAGLMATTIQAVVASAAGEGLAGVVSASVVDLVQGATSTLILSKIKIAAVVLLTAGMLTGASVWTCRVSIVAAEAPSALAAQEPPAKGRKPADSPAQAASQPHRENSAPKEKNVTVEVGGSVVDPDGKPFAGAKVYFLARQRQMQVEPEAGLDRVRAITDADGRFRFRVARGQLQTSEDEEVRIFHNTHRTAVVTAVVAGHGPGWAEIPKVDDAGHLTLKLAKDDVPIRGRVIDLQGRPIQGVKVRVLLLRPMRTDSLQPWLDALQKTRAYYMLGRFQGAEIYPEAAGLEKAVVTDAEGRFQLHGIGRERVATLRFEGPTIETRDVLVRTRPDPALDLPVLGTIPPSKEKYVCHGATFDHAAAPTIPVVGTVRDKDTGKPLAGIIIQARMPSAEGGPTAEGGSATDYLRTVSDKEGHYRLVGLPKRPEQIVRAYSGPGQSYVRLGKRVGGGIGIGPVRVGLGSARVDFELKRGVVIRGRVTDKATGQPVRAEVEYFIFSENQQYVEGAGDFREGFHISAWSGEDGSYSLVGLPGRGIIAAKVWSAKAERYIVAAGAEHIKGAYRNSWFQTYPYGCNAKQFHSLREVNPAKDAASVECNVAIDPGKTVTGAILDSQGQPLEGVHIEGPRGILPRFPKHMKTARFTATAINPNVPRWFFFFHREKQLAAAARLTGNEPKDFAIRLQPCATLKGRIVDSEGRPREGLALAGALEGEQDDPGERRGGFWGAKTDKQGRFCIAGLIPGLQWKAIRIQEGNMLTGQILRNVTFQAGQTKDLGDLQVNPLEDE
jgi:RNA polymerase sigma factor (sigma-70 family)